MSVRIRLIRQLNDNESRIYQDSVVGCKYLCQNRRRYFIEIGEKNFVDVWNVAGSN